MNLWPVLKWRAFNQVETVASDNRILQALLAGVISHEILPETHRQGHEQWATLRFFLGLMVMLFLDITLS